MKALQCILSTLVFSGLFISAAEAQQAKKPTAAVMDFGVISGISKDEAKALTNKFRVSFENTQKYRILERSQMESILKEQDFSLSEACNAAECAVQIGRLLAAEKMVIGEIGKVGKRYSVIAKLIDVNSSAVELSVNRDYEGGAEGLLDIFDEMAVQLTGGKPSSSKSSAKWWIIGGAVAGGGAAAVLLLGKKGGSDGPGKILDPIWPN